MEGGGEYHTLRQGHCLTRCLTVYLIDDTPLLVFRISLTEITHVTLLRAIVVLRRHISGPRACGCPTRVNDAVSWCARVTTRQRSNDRRRGGIVGANR